ncbi:FBD-associated F-box protein At5g22730-like [Tripterygium wilfordii]|nr:FBD-associated F-box protein At5g22730-like [Tripterygium wilfordii]
MGVINEFKRHKTGEGQDVVECKKSLCELPEAVLQHILSFLPMKESVRTSVLSKRWEYLWTSIPELDFAENKAPLGLDEYKANRTMFMDFISAVVRRNVRVACLFLGELQQTFSVASLLFHLCFAYCITYTCLRHSDTPSFNLVLKSQGCAYLLPAARCPLLEELTISECGWENVKAVRICCPNLQRLYIHEMCVDGCPWDESEDCQVMISGSSLKEFCYLGDFMNDLCFYDCSPLENLKIRIYNWDQRARTVSRRLYKLLSGLSDVKRLKFASPAIEVLNYDAALLDSLPLFSNLSFLGLNYGLVNLDSKALLKILQNSPKLETLQFSKGINLSSDFDKNRGILDPVPACFLSHLKTIEVCKCDGNKDLYVDVVQILLKKVVILDKLVLYCRRSTWTPDEMEKIRKELPRASQVLQMELM